VNLGRVGERVGGGEWLVLSGASISCIRFIFDLFLISFRFLFHFTLFSIFYFLFRVGISASRDSYKGALLDRDSFRAAAQL
jgi:hypothetical protein